MPISASLGEFRMFWQDNRVNGSYNTLTRCLKTFSRPNKSIKLQNARWTVKKTKQREGFCGCSERHNQSVSLFQLHSQRDESSELWVQRPGQGEKNKKNMELFPCTAMNLCLQVCVCLCVLC